jgi:hypothetical protein
VEEEVKDVVPPPGGEGGVREEFLWRQARFGGRKAVVGCVMRRGDEGGVLWRELRYRKKKWEGRKGEC